MSRRPLTEIEIAAIRAIMAARREGSLYALLGLRIGASPEEVDAAYREFVREWHPDRFYARDAGDLALAIEENFVDVTQAWRTLKTPAKRAQWHREKGIPDRAAPAPEPPSAAARATTLPPTPGAHVLSPSDIRRARPPSVAPAPPPEPPKPKPPAFLTRALEQAQAQVAKARQHYAQGKELFDAGQFSKAETALRLATTFDPRNPEYAELHKKAMARANELKARQFTTLAEQEESYQRYKEATAFYLKATECDPPEGLAWYRLAQIQRTNDQDTRSALGNLRKAVAKEPKNVTYRLALAEVYVGEKLAANAMRELTAILEVEPKHEAARALMKQLKR